MTLYIVGERMRLHQRRNAVFINTTLSPTPGPRILMRRNAVQLQREPLTSPSPSSRRARILSVQSSPSMSSVSFSSNETFEIQREGQPGVRRGENSHYIYNPDFLN